MASKQTKLSADASAISWFVRELEAVHDHFINEEGWQALRNGTYLGGSTASQTRKKGPGGRGLVCSNLPKNEWDEAWNEIVSLRKRESTISNLDEIERERRDAHIDRFLEKSLETGSDWDKDLLFSVVDEYARTERWAELDILLQDVRTVGLKAALRRRDYGKRTTLFKYSLRTLEAAGECLLAWILMQAVAPGFQRIIVCLLILSYSRISERALAIHLHQLFGVASTDRQFLRAFRLLGDRPSKFWREDESTGKRRAELTIANVNFLISSFKYSGLALIALYGLIRSVLA